MLDYLRDHLARRLDAARPPASQPIVQPVCRPFRPRIPRPVQRQVEFDRHRRYQSLTGCVNHNRGQLLQVGARGEFVIARRRTPDHDDVVRVRRRVDSLLRSLRQCLVIQRAMLRVGPDQQAQRQCGRPGERTDTEQHMGSTDIGSAPTPPA